MTPFTRAWLFAEEFGGPADSKPDWVFQTLLRCHYAVGKHDLTLSTPNRIGFSIPYPLWMIELEDGYVYVMPKGYAERWFDLEEYQAGPRSPADAGPKGQGPFARGAHSTFPWPTSPEGRASEPVSPEHLRAKRAREGWPGGPEGEALDTGERHGTVALGQGRVSR